MPGKEALYEPGKKEGEMKMIRESHGVVAYTWILEGDNSHWEKVGDVLSGTNKNNEGQTMFEGKVINVRVKCLYLVNNAIHYRHTIMYFQ